MWAGWDGRAIDLQAGLRVEEASMLNYEAVVSCAASLVARPLCLVGRGMGALAAMLAARRVAPEALVLLSPWPPSEVGGFAAVDVDGSVRPESRLAVDECRRGLSVRQLPARTLVVGSPSVAAAYGADELDAADLPSAVDSWLRSASASAT